MGDRNAKVLLSLIYAIPSLLLYIIVLIILLTKKEFSTSFFKLFCLNGFLDTFQWINFYLTWRVANAPAFFWLFELIPANGIIPTLIVWSYYYSFYAQLTTFFFLTFNRFTVFFIDYHKIWEYLLPISFIICFLIGWPVTWMYIVVGGEILYAKNSLNQTDAYMVVSAMRVELNIDDSLIQAIFVLTISGLCVTMNIITGIRLLIRYINFRNIASESKVDIKLFIMSFIMLISYSLTCLVLYQFMCCINDHLVDLTWYDNIMEVWYYAADLNLLLPPWLLIFTSRNVRKHVINTLKCRFRNRHTSSTQNLSFILV